MQHVCIVWWLLQKESVDVLRIIKLNTFMINMSNFKKKKKKNLYDNEYSYFMND